MPPTYAECLHAAASEPALVAEFDRLNGTRLATIGQRTPLDTMIDQATGHEVAELAQFCQFVFWAIWLPLQEGLE
jgi:hypothetical protein